MKHPCRQPPPLPSCISCRKWSRPCSCYYSLYSSRKIPSSFLTSFMPVQTDDHFPLDASSWWSFSQIIMIPFLIFHPEKRRHSWKIPSFLFRREPYLTCLFCINILCCSRCCCLLLNFQMHYFSSSLDMRKTQMRYWWWKAKKPCERIWDSENKRGRQ